jgi:hypothetical protein
MAKKIPKDHLCSLLTDSSKPCGTMTTKQQERFEMRLSQYERSIEVTPGIKSLIYTLACVELEEEQLQEYINEHGTCYEVVGTAGDILSKMRPQWNQLKESRMRKQALIVRIESKGKTVTEDELDEFLTK